MALFGDIFYCAGKKGANIGPKGGGEGKRETEGERGRVYEMNDTLYII
jgi:hypothetical protein